MKNSDYWKQRFVQLENAQNQASKDVFKQIENLYHEAQNQLEGKILMWYQRFAENNGITLGEAKQYMKSADLKEFKWTVEEYIKYGKENDGTGKWMKELENASAKFHISKYEALKIHIRQSIEEMYAKQSKTVDKAMKNIYKSGYYHTAYELQKGFGIGWDIAGVNQAKLEKVIGKPWAVDGINFSERIWNNKDKLISELHKEITKNIMLGEGPRKAIESVSKKMNTSKSNAGRLVMTESAYFSSLVQKDCFNDLDVEKYEIVATLDSHTSEICRDLDGKVFEMKDFESGTTAPPFHPFCRSTTVPYFDDDFGEVGERAARDEKTGKTYYVPGNMTYRQWESAFVKGGDKSGLEIYKNDVEKSVENGIINKINLESENIQVHTIGKIDRNIYSCITDDIITDEVIITGERIQHIKDRHPNDFERFYSYIPEIIKNPDYILEANKPKTAFILKEISNKDEHFQLILRLITSEDINSYSNSIITFLKVSNKKWNKYLRNKKILYKKE